MRKQPMFNRIPFRRISWIMSNVYFYANRISQFLYRSFEHIMPIAVASPAINENQNGRCIRIVMPASKIPPSVNGIT